MILQSVLFKKASHLNQLFVETGDAHRVFTLEVLNLKTPNPGPGQMREGR